MCISIPVSKNKFALSIIWAFSKLLAKNKYVNSDLKIEKQQIFSFLYNSEDFILNGIFSEIHTKITTEGKYTFRFQCG